MAACTEWQIVTIIVACAIVGTNMLVLARKAKGTDWRGALRWARQSARSATLKPAEEDPTEGQVRRNVSARRVLTAKSMLTAFTGVLLLLLLPVVLSIAQGVDRTMTQVQDTAFLISLSLLTLLAACPCLINARTLDAWHFVVVVSCCAYFSPLCISSEEVRVYVGGLYLVQFMLSVFNLRLRALVTVYALANLTIVWTITSGERTTLKVDGTRIPVHKEITELSFGCLCCFLLMVALQQCFESMVRQGVEKEAKQNKLSAVRALLDTICDVVVEMDTEFCITNHSSELAALLLLSPQQSLQSAQLRDHMPSEDREDFECCMRSASAESRKANVFHARMRDTLGSSIRMEMFSVPFVAQGDRPCFILGMREYTDVAPYVEQPESRKTPPPAGAKKSKPRREHSGGGLERGTPAVLERETLGELAAQGQGSNVSDTSSASDQSSDLEAGAGEVKETMDRVMYATLKGTMATWVSFRRLCCPMHAAADDAIRLAQRIQEERCVQDFLPKDTWQCPTCGIMDEDMRQSGHKTCYVCKQFFPSKSRR